MRYYDIHIKIWSDIGMEEFNFFRKPISYAKYSDNIHWTFCNAPVDNVDIAPTYLLIPTLEGNGKDIVNIINQFVLSKECEKSVTFVGKDFKGNDVTEILELTQCEEEVEC